MNRRDFLRQMGIAALLLKIPDLLGKVPKPVMYPGSTSPLDEVDFPYVATGPHATATDLIADGEDIAPWDILPFETEFPIDDGVWTNEDLGSVVGWINLEVKHFPTEDVLFMRSVEGSIAVGKMTPDGSIWWWVEPRCRHAVCWENVPLLEVPMDGQMHHVAITWEKGYPMRAYLDGNKVKEG